MKVFSTVVAIADINSDFQVAATVDKLAAFLKALLGLIGTSTASFFAPLHALFHSLKQSTLSPNSFVKSDTFLVSFFLHALNLPLNNSVILPVFLVKCQSQV